MKETLYLAIDKDIKVGHRTVTLNDIGSLWCSNEVVLAKCKAIKIIKIKEGEDRVIMTVMKVIKLIQEMDANIDVVNLGEADFIIDYAPDAPPNKIFQWGKAVCVAVITFCGAAFAIMTFNNDGSVSDIFALVYELVMGVPSNGFTVIEASYSIGLAAGIIIFFNHFKLKKMLKDPTPIEVKMRIYEDEVNTAVIQTANRKGSEIDVD